MEVGGYLDDEYPNIVVDVHNPEVTVKVEVRDFGAYVYADENKVQGQGGMPIGTGSKATLLLSGGIDSPVACLLYTSFLWTTEKKSDIISKTIIL